MILLSVAGNETTRNAISHGMLAFFDHPDQWELYCAERPATAPDEIVRWATPVTAFQRTAKADTMVGGQEIKKGERVGLFYRSANFDEEVFDEPGQFDITRNPNPHLGFGGTGAHYCVGVEPGQARDRPDLQRHRRRDAGHPPGWRRRAAALGLAERHQAPPGQLRLAQHGRHQSE